MSLDAFLWMGTLFGGLAMRIREISPETRREIAGFLLVIVLLVLDVMLQAWIWP